MHHTSPFQKAAKPRKRGNIHCLSANAVILNTFLQNTDITTKNL
jgi:hypothetical protein